MPGGPRIAAHAQVAKNGEFQFPHLSEMKLFLRDQVLNDSWFISSVRSKPQAERRHTIIQVNIGFPGFTYVVA